MTTSLPRSLPRPLLSISALSVGYGDDTILDGVNLDVAQGEVVGLIGETGSGKSTLCRAVLGFAPVRSGRIDFDGTDVVALRRRGLRRLRSGGAIQYVFQDPLASLDPDWSVLRSVTEPLVLSSNMIGFDESVRTSAERAFGDVGLDTALLDRRPAELSGGQRQRAVIARALITRPRLLLCDEPVSALDARNRIVVLELFAELRERYGMAIVFVSHDIGSIAGTCDRLAVLHEGVIVEDGPARDVIRTPTSDYARRLIADVPSLP
ncbi:dipeptide/oligopeptide/nickel ABC transporter ATP-binding protein [Mycobacterium sp. 236(2023)]|uniref:ABC transporter ATP-binding protein n=1 Tax=Mycobacterium sp. 236(2023) TaxID=3038163 RepID=UPI0024155764|nr:dipeptide/oligopeptide/nickel ABC transporter ATP-binding protein [Mycobacterium sp. 236(2023)]MDG4667624.1 dipeptide/oligopeptide/nickel ABC transporter ATP-binding protein [Mycobacterium sp. 236(2023)]